MAALPKSRAARAALAGAAVLLVGGAVVGLLRPRSEPPAVRESREFAAFLHKLSSQTTSEVALAAAEVPTSVLLRDHPERITEAASAFSEAALRRVTSVERLDLARAFWRGILLLEDRVGLALLPPELALLRHATIRLAARGEDPAEFDRLFEGDGGARVRQALGDLAGHLFRTPAPPREMLGALLWDRTNLEEMGGLAADALASWRLLTHDRIRDHPESGRTAYLLAKADLLGRIRRRFPPEVVARDTGLAAGLDSRNDPELSAFRSEEGGAAAHLLDGVDLLHRGDPAGAAVAIDQYLAAAAGPASGQEGREPSPLLDTRIHLAASLLRATAQIEAARAAFRAAEAIRVPSPLLGASARGALLLRRARLLAELGFREEFESAREALPRGDGEDARLLAALGEAVFGDRERGAAELKKLLAGRDDLPDAKAFEEAPAGARTQTCRALFEVGQIHDELGDLPGLERTIARLETAIETESDEGYLAFLRAVLRLRRGQTVEAWGDLERVLDRREFPPGLTRREVARFMEGAEEAADLLGRARSLLESAERDLAFLRSRKKEIDGGLALQASMALWAAQAEGEAIDPGRFAPRREAAEELLTGLREEIDAHESPTYALDRAWIDLRNAIARSYRALAAQGRPDLALERLADLAALVGSGASEALQGEEASLLRARAAVRQAAGDRSGAIEDLRHSGRLFLAVAERQPVGASGEAEAASPSRAEAAAVFERAGDLEGVAKALAPLERTSRDPSILLRYGKALLGMGDLGRARDVLRRALALGEEVEVVVEEPGDPIHLGGHHFRDLPADLLAWLELYSFVDPLNGTGIGRIRYDAVRRTLQWRAPGESRFGRPIFIAEGEVAWLPSGDDPRKTILVIPKRGTRREILPGANGEWDLTLAYREAPVDPVQLEARLAFAEAAVRLARIAALPGDVEPLRFAERRLSGGTPCSREAIVALVRKGIPGLWKDAKAAPALRAEVEGALSSWRSSLAGERPRDRGGVGILREEWLARVEKDIDGIGAAAADPARFAEALGRDVPQLHERLRRFHLAALKVLLEREGARGPVRETLEEFDRDTLDGEAKEELLFLCENVGNRSLLWKRAMYLRGLQAERRAEEAGRPRGDRSVLGPPADPGALLAEARDIDDRLLRTAPVADGPCWIGRAVLALSRIEAKAGRLDEARKLLDRLADIDPQAASLDLLPGERSDLAGLVRSAAFARGDLARRAGDLVDAVRRYSEAVERHGRSPLVLWGLLQLGDCYQAQGLGEEAYRQYRRGRQLLEGDGRPEAVEKWFGEEQSRLVEGIRAAFPPDEAGKALAALEGKGAAGRSPKDERDFWAGLFDAKLKAIAKAK